VLLHASRRRRVACWLHRDGRVQRGTLIHAQPSGAKRARERRRLAERRELASDCVAFDGSADDDVARRDLSACRAGGMHVDLTGRGDLTIQGAFDAHVAVDR